MTVKEIVAEIKRTEQAVQVTKSEKLKNDYGKHLKRMQAELKKYKKMQKGQKNENHKVIN